MNFNAVIEENKPNLNMIGEPNQICASDKTALIGKDISFTSSQAPNKEFKKQGTG